MKIVYALTTTLLLAGCKADTHPAEKSVEVYPIKHLTDVEKCLASNPTTVEYEPEIHRVPLESEVFTNTDQDLLSFEITSAYADEYTSIKQMSFLIQGAYALDISHIRLRKSNGDMSDTEVSIVEPRLGIDLMHGLLPRVLSAVIVVSFKQGIADTFVNSNVQYTLHADIQNAVSQSHIRTWIYRSNATYFETGYVVNNHLEKDWLPNDQLFHVMVPGKFQNTYAFGVFVWARYPYIPHSPNIFMYNGACDWHNDLKQDYSFLVNQHLVAE